jgi:prepilin-type N-terminal cleavage/methylation domain-containing protein
MIPLSYIKKNYAIGQEKGFTLVELIVTLVLVGIIGTFTTLFMYTGLNGYLRAKDTAEGALKAQIALDRISLELRDVVEIGAFTNNAQIDYTYMTLDEDRKDRKIIYSNGVISLDVNGSANELLDAVSNFTMILTAANLNNSAGGKEEVQAIDVSFTVGEIRRPFNARIFPRNMVTEP